MKTGFQRSGGFSLVELMVSVVIGMLALLFALRLLTGSEQNRQSAMGGSDSMQNGMLALFSISGDAGQAGYGLNDPIVAGCDTVFKRHRRLHTGRRPPGRRRHRPMAPVVIESARARPGPRHFYSGSSASGTATLRLLTDYASGTRIVCRPHPLRFRPGRRDPGGAGTAGGKCALAQICRSRRLPAAGQQSWRSPRQRLPLQQRRPGRRLHGRRRARVQPGPGGSLSFHTWSVATATCA
jgi:type IV pilus assembly protein PilW